MRSMDRMSHKAQEMRGKAKRVAGQRTGSRKLAAQGRSEQTVAQIRQVGDDIKRAAHHAKRVLSR